MTPLFLSVITSPSRSDSVKSVLYVPTMTSYEWKPGNVYNGQVSPHYRAISYTWGRWRLRPGQKRRDPAALRKPPGVPWEIPRVDSTHFTPAQLARALDTVCNPRDTNLIPVVFVWLDLACIDQRLGPLPMLEVGRQAGIFARSDGVAVWLSHVVPTPAGTKPSGAAVAEITQTRPKNRVKLESRTREKPRVQALLKDLERGLGLFRRAADESTILEMSLQDVQAIYQAVSMLLSDPWWSSLWTLQEAMLGRESFFILGNGAILRDDSAEKYTLQEFARIYRQSIHRVTAGKPLSDLAWQNAEPWVTAKKQPGGETRQSVMWSLIEWFDAASISAINPPDGFFNEALLLTNANHRIATRDTDHIYGIQQVFGFQLGSTRPGINPRLKFSRRVLEDDLGSLLMSQDPVRSQLFVFIELPIPGRSWHVNHMCHTHPELAVRHIFQARYEPSTRTVGGIRYGHFQGNICAFADINRRWDKLLEEGWHTPKSPKPSEDKHDVGNALDVNVEPGWRFVALRRFYPDIVNPLLRESEERRETEGAYGVHIPDENRRQVRFGRYLERRFSSNRLIVLHLGCSDEKQFGLLLVQVRVSPENVVFWYRLGVVVWYFGRVECSSASCHHIELSNEDKTCTLVYGLDGNGSMWEESEGIFE